MSRTLVSLSLVAISCGGPQPSVSTDAGRPPVADQYVGRWRGNTSRVLTCADSGPAHTGISDVRLTKASATELSASATIPVDIQGGQSQCSGLEVVATASTATFSGSVPCSFRPDPLVEAQHTATLLSVELLGPDELKFTFKTRVAIRTVPTNSTSQCSAEVTGRLSRVP